MASVAELLAQYVPSYPQVQGALQSAREAFVPERNVGNTLEAAMNMLPMGRLGPIKAYHGSPHNFNRFDISKIGTGEGAQAYGHGLYFAENPQVAETYKRATGAPGHMYEVNINANRDQFLNWDKPITQQPAQIRQALRELGVPEQQEVTRLGARGEETFLRPETGSGALYALGKGDIPLASQKLGEAGIPGIQYLDQGSRGQGQGSSNYVLFNDSIIDIMRKYGITGAIAPGAMGAVYGTQDRQQ